MKTWTQSADVVREQKRAPGHNNNNNNEAKKIINKFRDTHQWKSFLLLFSFSCGCGCVWVCWVHVRYVCSIVSVLRLVFRRQCYLLPKHVHSVQCVHAVQLEIASLISNIFRNELLQLLSQLWLRLTALCLSRIRFPIGKKAAKHIVWIRN